MAIASMVFKLHPFLSILIGNFITGLGTSLPAEAVAKAFSKGERGYLVRQALLLL